MNTINTSLNTLQQGNIIRIRNFGLYIVARFSLEDQFYLIGLTSGNRLFDTPYTVDDMVKRLALEEYDYTILSRNKNVIIKAKIDDET